MFESNVAVYTNCELDEIRDGNKDVTSAVFAEIPIELKGNIKFINNIGGGIIIIERQITINGNIVFDSNCSPYDGGGLSLEDESFVSDIKLIINLIN